MDSKVKDDHSLVAIHGPGQSLPVAATLDLILQAGKLLFANGQTTEAMVVALRGLATAHGFQATIFAAWGEPTVRLKDGVNSQAETIAVEPAGMDIRKVSATMNVTISWAREGWISAQRDQRYRKFLHRGQFHWRVSPY